MIKTSPRLTRELVRFACPCGHRLAAWGEEAGQTVPCPLCQRRLIIPARPPMPLAAPAARKLTTGPGGKGPSAVTVLFGLLTAAFFTYGVVWLPGDNLPGFKVAMLGVATALVAALFTYFIAGKMTTRLEWTTSVFGKVTVGATGSVGVFVFVLVWWFSVWNPSRENPKHGPAVPSTSSPVKTESPTPGPDRGKTPGTPGTSKATRQTATPEVTITIANNNTNTNTNTNTNQIVLVPPTASR